jgi:hypothetical protein
MKTYLIQFKNYNYYNGNLISLSTEILLVYAESYVIACQKIRRAYPDADSLTDLTME